jgi:hypothetical protein
MKHPGILFLSCMIFTAIMGCSGSGGGDESCSGLHTISYEVSTSKQDTSITYIDATGKIVTIPRQDTHSENWSISFCAKDGAHLSLFAQIYTGSPDQLWLSIYVDNIKVVELPSYTEGVSAKIEYDIPMTD